MTFLMSSLLYLTFMVACSCIRCGDAGVLLAQFDPTMSGGLQGRISISYDNPQNPSAATFISNLDFSQINMDAVKAAYPNCAYPMTSFPWHLHVKWNRQQPNGFLAECSPQVAGGHYDPTFACPSVSQYANDLVCKVKNVAYKCDPFIYKQSPSSCEIGDFSGKFGKFQSTLNGIVQQTNVDYGFVPITMYNQPMFNTTSVQWSIVVHADCPQHQNPRIACSQLFLIDNKC